MATILIVEDQRPVSKALSLLFELNQIACQVVDTPEAALERLTRGDIAVVVQDMNFSPGVTSGAEGMSLFRKMRAIDPSLPVLLMTAWTSLETAVQLVREGAVDYLAKPWDDRKLLSAVQGLLPGRTAELARRQAELAAGRGEAAASSTTASAPELCGLVYRSAAMQRVVNLALQVAAADVPVLITGPNGVGKEKISELIWANSLRRKGPHIKVNAGALPDELLESELFGVDAGAFTGATRRRLGRFEAAHRGTLFLDEIGNLSVAGQMKLLRVLQSGEFSRLGSNDVVRVDVRLITATNADLQGEMEAGRFRPDLFFRLNVVELTIPALAERPEDILPLAENVLSDIEKRPGAPAWSLSDTSRRALLEYAWPGNVRELLNRLRRATLMAANSQIQPVDLGLGAGQSERPIGLQPPRSLQQLRAVPQQPSATAAPGSATPTPALSDERARLEHLLRAHEGIVARVAEELGVSRQALYRRMLRLGIILERRPKS